MAHVAEVREEKEAKQKQEASDTKAGKQKESVQPVFSRRLGFGFSLGFRPLFDGEESWWPKVPDGLSQKDSQLK